MSASYLSFALFIRFAGLLIALCGLGNMVFAWVGAALPTQLISLTLTGRTDHGGTLYLMDTRPGLRVPVSDQAAACCAVWSPDGIRIAFSSVGGGAFIRDIPNRVTRSLPLPDKNPTLNGWSPDGQWLLFTNQRGDGGYAEVYRVQAETGQVAGIIATNDPFKRIDFAQWTPDGRFVIFALGTSYITRLWDIYRIDPDGQHLQLLSDGEGISYAPQIAPDGKRIAFISGSVVNNDLFLMDANGGHPRRLTETRSSERIPLWSPDGTHIVFQAYIDADVPRALDIMNADGTDRRRLADDSSFNNPPAWSPDGSQILYQVQRGNQSALYIMEVNTGSARRLLQTSGEIITNAAWQPQP